MGLRKAGCASLLHSTYSDVYQTSPPITVALTVQRPNVTRRTGAADKTYVYASLILDLLVSSSGKRMQLSAELNAGRQSNQITTFLRP